MKETVTGPDGKEYEFNRWYSLESELPVVTGYKGYRFTLIPTTDHPLIIDGAGGPYHWTPWTNRKALGSTHYKIVRHYDLWCPDI
jgi:hypothetical protein